MYSALQLVQLETSLKKKSSRYIIKICENTGEGVHFFKKVAS